MRVLLILLLTTVLSACGGGGESSSTSNSVSTGSTQPVQSTLTLSLDESVFIAEGESISIPYTSSGFENPTVSFEVSPINWDLSSDWQAPTSDEENITVSVKDNAILFETDILETHESQTVEVTLILKNSDGREKKSVVNVNIDVKDDDYYLDILEFAHDNAARIASSRESILVAQKLLLFLSYIDPEVYQENKERLEDSLNIFKLKDMDIIVEAINGYYEEGTKSKSDNSIFGEGRYTKKDLLAAINNIKDEATSKYQDVHTIINEIAELSDSKIKTTAFDSLLISNSMISAFWGNSNIGTHLGDTFLYNSDYKLYEDVINSFSSCSI